MKQYTDDELGTLAIELKNDEMAECDHENIRTVWTRIPGEAVEQPDHDVCVDCGAIML